MKKLYCILLLVLSCSLLALKAQDRHLIDSLQNEIKKYDARKKELGSQATPLMDSTKAYLYYEIVKEYLTFNDDSLSSYAQKCLTLSQNIGYKKGIGNGYNGMGLINMYRGNNAVAMDCFQKALKARTEIGDKRGMRGTYNNLGLLCGNEGKYIEAIQWHSKELKLEQELGDKQGIAAAYGKMGHLYSSLGNYPEAEKNFLGALKAGEELGNKSIISGIHIDIGKIYYELGNYPEALKDFRIGLKIANDTGIHYLVADADGNIGRILHKMGNDTGAIKMLLDDLKLSEETNHSPGIAFAEYNLGLVNLNLHNYSDALNYCLAALKEYEKINYKQDAARLYIVIGKVYEKQGKLQEAMQYLTKGLSLATELGAKEEMKDAYNNLADANTVMHDYKTANEDRMQFEKYYDTINNSENQKKLTSLQMQYDFNKTQDSAKAEQSKKDALTREEIENQKRIKNYTITGLAIVLFFLVFVFIQRNRIAREKNRSDELLLNILPSEVAEELKEKGKADAKQFDDVTVMFTDFKSFTSISETLSAKELVAEIDYCFQGFDNIIHKYNIEKIKTIGDSYMAAGGLPIANNTHPQDVVKAALEIAQFMENHKQKRTSENKPVFEIRIGINTGPVVAGIVGVKKFAYDIWGDTVNLASRMESSGEPGKINISGSTYELVKNNFTCTYRGKIQAKNKGEVDMYFVD